MYNDKSAKDLLAQFPQRLAEGGTAGTSVADWKAPVVGSPSSQVPSLGTSTSVPVAEFSKVAARPIQLKPLNELPGSPTGLSPSQQFARDRAAKQAALNAALAQAGAPLESLERRALLQRLYKGDLTPDALKTQVVDPLFEKRVENAFKLIGLPGTDNMPGQKAPTTAYNYWANQLKTGKISGADFEKKFLTSAAQAPTWSSNVSTQLAAANKARAALGMTALTEKDLPGYVAPPPVYNYGFGWNTGPMGFNNNNPLGMGSIGRLPAPPAPAPVIQPVDFSKPATTQLFAEGGAVKKPENPLEEGLTVKDPSEGGLSVRDYPNPYGLRAYEKKDGTYGGEMLPKSVGWAGELEGRGALQGSRVTEYSMEDDKGSFPTINPLLSREEIELVASGIVTPTIYKKAVQWRDMQAEKGASAFLNPTGYRDGGDVKKSEDPSLTNIASTLWKGFGNNPRNVETFDAMANMNPLMSAYRGAKTLANADYSALGNELTAPFYGTTSPEKDRAAASAAKDVLFGAMDVAPFAPFATAGVKAGGKALAKEVGRQIETGTGVIGRNTMDPRMYMAEFYSPAAKAVEGHKMDKMPAGQWISWLNSNAPKAAKEELNQTGARKWLEQQTGVVTKQQLADKIKQESPEILTKTMSPFNYDSQALTAEEYAKSARFQDFNLPDGNTNYREMTISLPVKEGTEPYKIPAKHAYGDPVADTNRIAHVRMNDRMDRKGNSVLFVEEIQSDLGQQGRKYGFLDEKSTDRDRILGKKVPKLPYAEDTKAWTGLALKKIIEEAVEKGYSSVAFTTGAQQNARYALTRVVDKLNLSPLPNLGRKTDNEIFLLAGYKNGETVYAKQILKKDLPDVLSETIGPTTAQQLLAQKPDIGNQIQSLKGKQLEIGGKGMVGYYDEMVPQSLKEELKKLGIKPEIKQIDMRPKPSMWNYLSVTNPGPKEIGMQMGFDITPELVNAVKEKGISKFKHGGEVSKFIKSKN